MPVLQQEMGWSVRGRWAGPRKLVGGSGGCRIVFGGIESLRVDLQAPMGTPLCKDKEGKGVGEGLARDRSDAKVRLFLRREKCLNTQFFAYLPP